jgi:hypothetical protein
LRGAALRAERQCAQAAHLTLKMREAKDASRYWVKADTIDDVEKTSFMLEDLPDDWRVVVDSHSSSPIFSDENAQMIWAALKAGVVNGEYVLDNQPFPDRDAAKAQLREKEKHQAQQFQQLLQQDPDVAHKALEKQFVGGASKKR